MARRLAAVLIADVVGYGRLSQVDEEGTRARFQADMKEVFEPNIAAHRGRLVKTMGDGLLVEFSSVVDALRCAADAPNPWPKFYGLQVLASAYGRLGRSAAAAATIEKLKTVLRERNEGELNQLLTQRYFVYKNEADIARLLDGLGKPAYWNCLRTLTSVRRTG